MATPTRGYNQPHFSSPTYIRPLPRFTLPYILESSPEIRRRILAKLHNSLPALISLRLVNKAFARYVCVYVFKEIWLVFKPHYWQGKDMEALKRVGTYVQRVIFKIKHNQYGSVEPLVPGVPVNTRIPYAPGRDYRMELEDRPGQVQGRSLMWTVKDHLNPVPELIEFLTSGGTHRGVGEGDHGGIRARANIPICKSGGPPDMSHYGPLFATAVSVKPFTEFFIRTPNLTSLVIQAPGNDLNWEYSSVDIALESLRLGAVTAGIKIQEMACLPIHILGLETLSATGRRIDVVPAAFGLLGWGGLKRLELAVNARMLANGAGGMGRDKHVYDRIVRAFLLALGRMGRNGIETLKFQWMGGETSVPSQVMDCPFLLSNITHPRPGDAHSHYTFSQQGSPTIALEISKEAENAAICATLTFPHLTRLYIRNVSITASALQEFLWERAPKCSFVSTRKVLLKDGEDHRYAMRGFVPIWVAVDEEIWESKRARIFSGDYQRQKGVAALDSLARRPGPGRGALSGP
ncbi:hypothetical protein L211DRAFT_883038 [Terfezia boudieri ATCC MYA-4762]|uniref:Uncharacterized protein n=1 Tax=Terfezia boudieri ATCC MYA-4762 TaxID=1051890 RepID=A0A3N4LPU4_9PEZI|nr:hypothetical protein L211DRAFT_883038 [Terfezia boudieri ATCC MYA-4762]